MAFLEEAPAYWHSNWKSQLIFLQGVTRKQAEDGLGEFALLVDANQQPRSSHASADGQIPFSTYYMMKSQANPLKQDFIRLGGSKWFKCY